MTKATSFGYFETLDERRYRGSLFDKATGDFAPSDGVLSGVCNVGDEPNPIYSFMMNEDEKNKVIFLVYLGKMFYIYGGKWNIMNEYKIKDFTSRLNESDVAYALINKKVDSRCLLALKEETGISGELLSGWLHMTPKTLRSYLTRKVSLPETVGEQVLLLTSLFRYGIVVFGSVKAFEVWLNRENGMLDGLKPIDLLGSVSGIRLIESRLSGIEYGDNA